MKKINTLFIGILSLMLIPLTSWGQRYLTETFPEVQVTSDLTYGVNATILLLPVVGQAIPEALKFDFYEPKNDETRWVRNWESLKRMAKIYIHGIEGASAFRDVFMRSTTAAEMLQHLDNEITKLQNN